MYADHMDFITALRCAFFNTATLQSTTGFSDEDFMNWHPTIWLILSFISIVGACAGSTSGGLKCIRVLMVWRLTKAEFKKIIWPSRQSLGKQTLAVLLSSIGLGVIITLVDMIIRLGLELLVK